MTRKKIDKWDAIVLFDEIHKVYTIYYDGIGGAIISDKDLEIAEKKFAEMMELAKAVRKVLSLDNHEYDPRNEKYINRLFQEWSQHGKIIIGVDVDDTILPWKFTDQESLDNFNRVISLLISAVKIGAYITIFTACNPDRYDEIIDYCKSRNLVIDSINQTPIDLPYGKHGSKIYANIFLDDRAGLNESLDILEKAIYRMISKQHTDNLSDVA